MLDLKNICFAMTVYFSDAHLINISETFKHAFQFPRHCKEGNI